MLSSLPSIPPRDAHTLWYTTSYRFALDTSSSPSPLDQSSPPPQQSAQPRNTTRRQNQPHQPRSNSALQLLIADEEAIANRKANICRFGATWIRPPGISKTYQAMADEQVEKAEQEAIARREQGMLEQQQAAAEAEAQAVALAARVGGRRSGAADGAMEGIVGAVEGVVQAEERDLDADIPEAEEVVSDESDEEEDDRDLDDDVPEAGSYEHTDTELDDDSSVIEDEDAHGPVVVQDLGGGRRLRTSLARSGDVESSMLVSSPLPLGTRGSRRERSTRQRQSLRRSVRQSPADREAA